MVTNGSPRAGVTPRERAVARNGVTHTGGSNGKRAARQYMRTRAVSAETIRGQKTPRYPVVMEPSAIWPPPIYIRENIGPQERYYVEHRWFAQWAWYDARATFYKKRYQRIQLGIGIGAVAVPVLVGVSGFDPMTDTALKIATVVISLMVAALTAWENVYKHGENWRLFRAAAEDLSREKSMYDMQAGPYLRAEQPFVRFVERCEVIMAQQNGRWLQQYQQDEKTISD